jgi:phosphoserine aminotransferase
MKNTTAQDHAFYRKSFEKSAQAILNFNDSGLSILEISHRSKDFVA